MTKPLNTSEQFHDALMGEDELGVVLRAHFYIEAEVGSLIASLLPFPEELPRLRYEQKLRLVCALGFDKTAFDPLKELGDLRNSFGHQIGAHLTEGMTTKLFEAFSIQDQEIVLTGYEQSRIQLGDSVPPFTELCPKDKFVVIAITLHKMLVGAVSESNSSRRA